MTPREYFESQGHLCKCSRDGKIYDLPLGYFVRVNWADSWSWSTLSDTGYLFDQWVSFSTVRNVDGFKWYKLTLLKLSLSFGSWKQSV